MQCMHFLWSVIIFALCLENLEHIKICAVLLLLLSYYIDF
jgi:hypothetical protein